MVPLMIFTDKAFRYSNFLAIVEDEFTPSLGWEADRAVWVSFGHWPKPLHFGMKALFDDAESVNVIRHYATMFDKGINVSESLDEDLDLPAGVDVAKAIGDAKAIEMDDDENATEMPAKAGQPMIKVPAASQSQKPPQGQKPPLQGSIQGKPAPNQGSKSLAAIKPQ